MQLHTWLASEKKSFDDGLELCRDFGISSVKLSLLTSLKGTKTAINKMIEWLTPISVNKSAVKQIYYSKDPNVKALDESWRRSYKTAHHIHQTILKNPNKSEKELSEAALKILDIFENEVDPIWRDLKEFDSTGKLPDVHFLSPKKEMSIVDKISRRNTLRTYISKFAKNEKKADAIIKWQEELLKLENDINNAV